MGESEYELVNCYYHFKYDYYIKKGIEYEVHKYRMGSDEYIISFKTFKEADDYIQEMIK